MRPAIQKKNGNTCTIANVSACTDEDLLTAICIGEAGNINDRDGKKGVMNVVMNRVADATFPNTVRDVVTASGQFLGLNMGIRRLNNPSFSDCRDLAREVMNSPADDPTYGALWFNQSCSKPCSQYCTTYLGDGSSPAHYFSRRAIPEEMKNCTGERRSPCCTYPRTRISHIRFTEEEVEPIVAERQSIQKKCSCGGGCSRCKGEEEAERVSMSIMKKESCKASAVSFKPSADSNEQDQISEIMSGKGSGQSLDDDTRSFLEPKFGFDFSRVRIHTDSYAARKSNELNAEAFTIGKDIFFNAGRYNPSSLEGKRLLGHELTHVVQQNGIGFCINCLEIDDRRKKIVETALNLSDEHYLMGAGGQIPDKGGGVNSRNVVLDPTNHTASVDVYYGKDKGTKTHACGGRYSKVTSMPEGNPANAEHQKSPSKYKWKRTSDRSEVWGEACEGKRHFDCGGFVSFCYHQACPEVKYPGPASGLLSSAFGWNDVKKEEIQGGDIAYRDGHAGLCISNTEIISALGIKWGVIKEGVNKYTKFGHLKCLIDVGKKPQYAADKKQVAKKPLLGRTEIPCKWNPSMNVSYDKKTYQFLQGIKHLILPISQRVGVPENSIAGAIADEFDTRRGIRGIVDRLQDSIIDALPECFIDVDRFFDIHSKLFNTLENDIGPANIKVKTALKLVQWGILKIPGYPSSDIKVNKIVNFLLTEKGTVEATAAVIRLAKSLFSSYITQYSKTIVEAIFVEYFKQGDSYYLRFRNVLKIDPDHKVCPGDDGWQYFFNREQINKTIHS